MNREFIYHQFTADDIRVNEDSCVMYCAFCVITPEACSSPDSIGQWRAIGQRQNINREGCVSNENDFASV